MNNKKGFTLIELLAVIVILGIVVAIAIPGINSVISNSRKKSVLAEAEILHSAALRKLASEPAFDFSLINKNNIKNHLETDGKTYDKVFIHKVDEKINVKLEKYGFRAYTDGKLTKVTTQPAYVAFEYNLSLGESYLNIQNDDILNQEVYVYQGTYEENIENINNNFSNPFVILTDLTYKTDLRSKLGSTGTFTLISTKFRNTGRFTSAEHDSYKNVGLIGIPHYDIKELGTSDMARMFNGAINFNQNINDWDVSSIKIMTYMFYMARNFNQPLNNWNTKNVTGMGGLFERATSFNQDISSWDTSSAVNMWYMFKQTPYNYPLNDWNVSKVKSMQSMFEDAVSFNQDLSNWEPLAATNMMRMFKNAQNFNNDLSSWNVTLIPDKPNEFDVGSSLTNENNPIWGTNGGN